MKTSLRFSLWSLLALTLIASIGLAAWRHHAERYKKFETAMFRMTDDRLFERGITAVDGGNWSIAWSSDSVEDMDAIQSALGDVGLSAFGSFGHGRGGWYVHRTEFFRAQTALKHSDAVKKLGIEIVEPSLDGIE